MPTRALISDQLLIIAKAIPKNLVEARLHQLELDRAWKDSLARYAEPRQIIKNSLFADKQPESPMDELPDALLELHMAGFFRAVGSAIDCLGGAIVGVLGLRSSILRSDYGNARKKMEREIKSGSGGGAIFGAFHAKLNGLETASGPVGWLKWAIDMRNMLVHRGRRTQIFAPRVEASPILSPSGQPLVRLRNRWFLPRAPGLSEIEEMVTSGGVEGLTIRITHDEAISQVLTGALTLARAVCIELLTVWNQRRANPHLIPQPVEQWAAPPPEAPPGFGTQGEGFSTAGIVSGGEIILRAMAAGVDDARRAATWRTYLATPKRP